MRETTSAMVELTQEIDESCVVAVGHGMVSPSLSTASRLRNARFRCVLPETAGYKPEVRSVVAKVTTLTVVKLSRQTRSHSTSHRCAEVEKLQKVVNKHKVKKR